MNKKNTPLIIFSALYIALFIVMVLSALMRNNDFLERLFVAAVPFFTPLVITIFSETSDALIAVINLSIWLLPLISTFLGTIFNKYCAIPGMALLVLDSMLNFISLNLRAPAIVTNCILLLLIYFSVKPQKISV